jgi:hypothetical protein
LYQQYETVLRATAKTFGMLQIEFSCDIDRPGKALADLTVDQRQMTFGNKFSNSSDKEMNTNRVLLTITAIFLFILWAVIFLGFQVGGVVHFLFDKIKTKNSYEQIN